MKFLLEVLLIWSEMLSGADRVVPLRVPVSSEPMSVADILAVSRSFAGRDGGLPDIPGFSGVSDPAVPETESCLRYLKV